MNSEPMFSGDRVRRQAQQAVDEAEAQKAEADLALEQAKMMQADIENKVYLKETGSMPQMTAEELRQFEFEQQMVVGTANRMKTEAIARGASKEEQEAIFKQGLQHGAQVLANAQFAKQEALYAKYSRNSYSGLKYSQLNAMHEARSNLRDLSSMANEREVGDQPGRSSEGSGIIFND
ncbi:hypothetical protein [Leptolyngbya sp. AN10]|uniref:hypothetical protein n=1 Tax=Leptolyngbya sp. AN10 TaxID=3423365 RepID=UPI003D322B38